MEVLEITACGIWVLPVIMSLESELRLCVQGV